MHPRISTALRSLDSSEWIATIRKKEHPMKTANGHPKRFEVPSRKGPKVRIDHAMIRDLARENKGKPPRVLAELYKAKTGDTVSMSHVRNILGSCGRVRDGGERGEPHPIPVVHGREVESDLRFDPEVDAIRRIHEVMATLDPTTRSHVARWVAGRFLSREG